MRDVFRTLLLIVIGAALGVASMLVWTQVEPRPVVTNAAAPPLAPLGSGAAAQPTAATPAMGQAPVVTAADGTVASVYERVSPSVVRIVVLEKPSGNSNRQARGEGSGVVLDKDGFILTNSHVVGNAQKIQVEFDDGIVVPADFVAQDRSTDIAIIRVTPDQDTNLMPATLGDSDKLKPGEVAIAIGNPLSLERTVTVGVVSGIGRTRTGLTSRPLRRVIQTDAALNPGNSGGPLLNGRGEVVGINTMIESRSQMFASVTQDTIPEGIGFAVPINTVKRILPALMKGESVDHAWLGISGQPIDKQVQRELKLPVDRGVLVTSVVKDGPAANAGIQGGSRDRVNNQYGIAEGGDIILAINDVAVKTVDDVAETIDSYAVGDPVQVQVNRNGENQTVPVTLGAWPARADQ